MAISLGHRPVKPRMMASINITPFTDVCLVLLIIFMVSASFIGSPQAADVKLPPAARKSTESLPPRDITVSLNRSGDLFVEDEKVTMPQLQTDLRDYAMANTIRNVIIKADQSVMYDDVVKIMNLVKNAGVTYMSLAVDQTPAEKAGG